MITTVFSGVLLGFGAFFCLVGAIGVVRLPDVYARMHASGINDTLGAALVLLGLAVHSGPNLTSVKLVLVLFFLLVASPTASHALANAAMTKGLEPQGEKGGGGET
jgi:multicomponent Na+:H+ antiporter subunit G